MNAHYDFYESLGLGKDSSTYDLRSAILETLEGLKRDGVPAHDARVQENSVALSVLGDDRTRSKYDARLSDDSAARMGIPELRALASTGSFPDELEQPAAPFPQALGAHDDQATSVIPAAAIPAGTRGTTGNDETDQIGETTETAEPTESTEAPGTAAAPAPAPYQPQPAQQRAATAPGIVQRLLGPAPGTAKGLAFTLAGIGGFAALMALTGMLLIIADSYTSVGSGVVHLMSTLIAVLLIPKVLRGRDETAIIPVFAAPIAMALIHLNSLVTDVALDISRGASIAVDTLLFIAWVAAAVLAILPDTRAWLSGTYVAAPTPAAPNHGAPQYGAPRYGAPDQGSQQYRTPQYGTQQYGAPEQGTQQ